MFEPMMLETGVSLDEMNTEFYERRAQSALHLARYIAWSSLLALVCVIVLGWFIKQPQWLIPVAVVVPASASAWAYPWFYRRGQARLGIQIFLVSLLILVAIDLVVIPDFVLTIAIGYALVIILSNLLLGAQDSLWLVALTLVTLVVASTLLRIETFASLAVTFDPIVGLAASVFFGMFAALVMAIAVRQMVLDQEGYFRQARLASRQVEQRAVEECEQRQRLQATVQTYVDYMARVARGDLSARVNTDEIGQGENDPLVVLGRQLNAMITSLEGMIEQVWNAANNLSSAAAEILAATTQQASGASEQSAAISETTTTVDEVKVISEQATTRAGEVATASRRTVEVSRDGRKAVQATIESMGQIKERVEGIAGNILTLSEQTLQIGEIIITVNEIASQSNILALNAAIEAARAGEHGKGFAVVAMEVRNLAEQSRQATAQVKSILSEIQKATNATVMATEEGTKGVDKGVQLAAQAQQAIEQLAGVINESAQMATQMVAGGQQQMSGIEQIALAMQSINQATLQSLSSTRQAEKAAQNLNELARVLGEMVKQYQVQDGER